jgi:PAS domain S-box-containing protein
MHEEKTILLVEDEALIAVIEKETLKKHGFNVVLAHSGEKAIEAVHNTPGIDLILMDINLGKNKMDGTEAAETIVKERDIPVLFLSSYTQAEVVQKAEKITSYGYVVKDSGETVLITSIKMAFKLHEAHQKVKEGAEQFRAITNTAIDGFWVVDIEGHILDINEAYCLMTGYSREELLKMSIPDLDAIEDEAMARQHMEKLIENGSDRFESKHRCKDGQVIDVEVSTILIQEQRCLVFIQDITKRKRAEEKERASERKYRIVADNTYDWEYWLDPQERFIYCSPSCERVTGYKAEEFLADPDLYDRIVHPDHRTDFVAHKKGARHACRTDEMEFRIIRSDGTERWIGHACQAVYDDNGLFTGIRGSNRDITDRKQREEVIRESKLQLEMVIKASNTGLWDWDLRTNKVHFSPEWKRQIGYEEREISNDFSEWQNRVHPDDLERAQSTVKIFLENPYPDFENEYRFRHKNGSYRWILAKASVLTDENGNPLRMLGSHLDITERKKTEEELRYTTTRLEALWDITKLVDADFKTICDHILSEIVQMTKSEYGFFGFISEDEFTMTIYSWSGDAMKDCSTVDKPQHFPISEAGVWAEAIRKRTPFVMNDYTIYHEAKKGCPDGHVIITNLLVIPIFSGDRIVSVTAVANKASVYDDDDISQITAFVGAVHAIIDRKLAEDKIKSLLAEKELLLKETHHRVKNNMNTIIALLALQSDVLKEPSAIAAMHDAQSRIQSMMVLYDKLYLSDDFRKISTQEYLTSLIDQIVRNFPNRGLVTIKKQIDDLALDAKILSNLGIILNEILTNAMKHAFIGKEHGVIVVYLSFKGNHVTLMLHDNGVGIPESVNIANSTGFGMQLIGILTEQLEGTIRLERQNGTKFILDFDT